MGHGSAVVSPFSLAQKCLSTFVDDTLHVLLRNLQLVSLTLAHE